MSKFKKKVNTKQEIPTASMPDVVFMLLFFFMVTTKMRETSINVEQKMPQATQLKKLVKKSLISYLYIGAPKKVDQFGKEPKIQANDVFIETKNIVQWVNSEKSKLDEVDRDAITVSLKVDVEAKRGLISDVETELRKANARRVLYSANQKLEL
ncbi:MAG: biopolymer transporter ExbD [Cyclobacteriaceae bacterium]|jgi:biopolymer transport protein ExbD|nr:biopolymer transporter ExbD [Cyclobacteriaceae bacterium]MDH4297044.1 biopolymer transporter ExbD [Cyclobacteriaceae bacterium]MDH5248686.1 biopolymer transporter ExbD [Cyclobacteriaceae bacterium]